MELERQDPEAEGWAESGGSAWGAQPGSPVADRQQEPGPRCRAGGCRRLARALAVLTAVQLVTHKTPTCHTQTRARPCVTGQPSALRVEAAEAELPVSSSGPHCQHLAALGNKLQGQISAHKEEGPGGFSWAPWTPPSS